MKKKNNFYLFCRFCLMLILKILFFFKVSGRENIPKNGGCIIASNHLSYLDPVVLSVASPRMLSFMSKEELFENKWFSKLITALNAFPLKRGAGDIKALRLAIEKLKEGCVLIIFPEGTRSRTGDIRDAQVGISMLASRANVPVVPAYIYGTDNALPASSKKISFFTPIHVHFGTPLTLEVLDKSHQKETYEAFSREIIEKIKDLKSKN